MKNSNGVTGENKSDIARREEEILAFWKKEDIFQKTLAKAHPKGEYVFYDGPPFATGLPHHGSLLSSIIKDVIPRYKTMRGYRVLRRWGWDCHGLPIENLVEKKLGLKTKKDIEKIGTAAFNKAARDSVVQFVDDWKQYVERVGRFVDFDNSYKTMDNEYIESVWWGLKRMNDKGLLYEGKKVLMYCPHCETPLAKAEIAADNTYQDITEEAVTVKFKIKNPEKKGFPANSYILAWTTTPWTLPGNTALAVKEDLDYVVVTKGTETYVVAKDRLPHVLPEAVVEHERKGKELVGLEYEPLYEIASAKGHRGKKQLVVGASFVTTEEGTGIVHIAPAYGEDDFAVGQKEKMPVLQLLDSSGRYTNDAPEFLRGTYLRDAQDAIKDDLEKRGMLFARAKHTHSYPHCWRCGTPLIYNAVASWFINIQKVKGKMLSENEKVSWVPEHLKEGRFKHIVENAPDWTISRNRYWASPLPIWRGKKSKRIRVIGSIEELLSLQKRSGNRYFLMRHGEAKSNGGFIESKDVIENPLTERGEAAVRAHAHEFKRHRIDLIVASPLKRAQQTARILQKELGLPDSAVMTDKRIAEIDVGSMNGKTVAEWDAQFATFADRFAYSGHGGETYKAVWQRVGDFLFDVERRYTGKQVLIISHGTPIWLMKQIAKRTSYRSLLALCGMHTTDEGLDEYPKTAEWAEIAFVRYPRNEEGDPDLHRPYIDEMQLVDASGEEYERVPEVVDCWVESGSMPFAQHHYVGKPLPAFNPRRGLFSRRRGYPADFIAEYIAQTRTWFYYMHAVGALLFDSRAFKTVVSTGTVLAHDGAKISKSKGNYTDPLALIDRYGADAYRFYLMGSVVMQAEDVLFKDEEVKEAHNRVVGILSNTYAFFELYKREWDKGVIARNSENVLDMWVFARLDETTGDMTEAFDAYDLPRACRSLRSFVEDYSTWYIRRSRDRVRRDDATDKGYALATQREVFLTLSKLTAPLMPFLAEVIHRGVYGKEESVHLSAWPSCGKADAEVLAHMKGVRSAVSRALEARNKAGIKVRQPLSSLRIRSGVPAEERYLSLIRDEVNVKEVRIDPAIDDEVVLDTHISEELRREGVVRDAIRAIQDKRKEEKLSISDRPKAILSGNGALIESLKSQADEIGKATQVRELLLETNEDLPQGTFDVRLER